MLLKNVEQMPLSFQSFNPDKVVTKKLKLANYQKKNLGPKSKSKRGHDKKT